MASFMQPRRMRPVQKSTRLAVRPGHPPTGVDDASEFTKSIAVNTQRRQFAAAEMSESCLRDGTTQDSLSG
jgi:hypothetical protein